MRTIGNNGLDLVKHFEGCVLSVYLDSSGYPTCGVGHLVRNSDNLRVGDPITQAAADAFLESDLSAAVACVDAHAPDLPTKNARAALVSLVFNIGCSAFSGSALLRAIQHGQRELAADEFLAWTRSGHSHPRGLLLRRKTERDLFLAADGPMPAGWLTRHEGDPA